MIKIVSWNLNSINARINLLQKLISKINPDIILLQELRCPKEKFPRKVIETLGYNIALNCEKDRNGVAILSKFPIENITLTLPNAPLPQEARYIQGIITINEKKLIIASIYVPYGTEIYDKRFSLKLKFLNALKKNMKLLNPKENFVIIGGDYNVDPDKDFSRLCCTIKEQEKFKELLKKGYSDGFRFFNPTKEINTKRKTGLRLDHFLIGAKMLSSVRGVKILKQSKKETLKSKHTPLICILKWSVEITALKNNIYDINNANNIIEKTLANTQLEILENNDKDLIVQPHVEPIIIVNNKGKNADSIPSTDIEKKDYQKAIEINQILHEQIAIEINNKTYYNKEQLPNIISKVLIDNYKSLWSLSTIVTKPITLASLCELMITDNLTVIDTCIDSDSKEILIHLIVQLSFISIGNLQPENILICSQDKEYYKNYYNDIIKKYKL